MYMCRYIKVYINANMRTYLIHARVCVYVSRKCVFVYVYVHAFVHIYASICIMSR